MTEAMLVRTTFGNIGQAQAIGRRIVEERLAACVTITSGATSTYRWAGEIEQAAETVCLFKTTAILADRLVQRLAGLHDYDLPVIERWPMTVNAAAVAWLETAVHG